MMATKVMNRFSTLFMALQFSCGCPQLQMWVGDFLDLNNYSKTVSNIRLILGWIW
jgi:hypothetical protein